MTTLRPSAGEARPPEDHSPGAARIEPQKLLNALPNPVLAVDGENRIVDANAAAEIFFDMGLRLLRRQALSGLLPPSSPVLALVAQAREDNATMNEYRIGLGHPRIGPERFVDVHLAPLPEIAGGVIIMLQERTIADKMDRQLTHRGAARSVSALAAMLAHEIKNPLSGIRGAAQLLEQNLSDEDRMLTRLICDETDRIVKLVSRMDSFSDLRPVERTGVNVHAVLDHVKKVARAGFARHITFVETYDPSLPLVYGNRDQLVQVFLNLVKNAAEAIGPDAVNGEIELASAFRPGVSLRIPGHRPAPLPLEFCVRDNGPGVPDDIAPHLFDPFITSKVSGSGLGLALVAKIIGDHGGVIECESQPRRTTFRILLPVHRDGGRDGPTPRAEG